MYSDAYWEKPRDTPSLRELEQLRVLAMYEFEPPLTSQELVGALRANNNRPEDAYNYLKANRRLQRSVAIPLSAPAATSSNTGTPEREREKRRMSASSVDGNGTPSKRHKDLSFVLIDSEEKTEEGAEDEENQDTNNTPETQQDSVTAADCAKAQQLLLQTVEDRVAARQPPRNPEWVHEVWASLQVPAVLEVAMQLNLTVDALAAWVKDVENRDAQDIMTRGAALIVEVVASLPPYATNANDSAACPLKDEVLSKKDEEVSAIVQAESQEAELSAYTRAIAAKSAIECLSSACKAYMDRLGWFAQSNDSTCNDKTDVEKALKLLNQKLTGIVEKCMLDVKEAERTLAETQQKKEAQTLHIVEFVRKRHAELVAQGETEASASLLSVVDVWKKNDVEVQARWSSRSESEQRVEKSVRALKVAEHALTYYKKISILFRKVRERREDALTNASKCLEEARLASETRATAALESIIPMITRELYRYYEFHSIQQSKAKKKLQEQEKALAAHQEFFGDSAPISKGDIEQRIREFIGVTQSSMQGIMEIAEGQQQLWEDKQAILPESVRLALILEYKALWLQLSGPMRDVMKKFVATIEEAAGGAVAVPAIVEQQIEQPQPEPAMPVFTNALDEQVIPAFTVPAFSNSQAEPVTAYRTAISAIVAEVVTSSPPVEKKRGNDPAAQTEMTPENIETRATSSLPQLQAPRETRREFDAGSILYSKITVGENCTQFVRGVVLKQLENDMYLMQYDNGDKFSVGSSFLFTKELMEQNLKAGGVAVPDQDTEMEDAEQAGNKSTEGGCTIM